LLQQLNEFFYGFRTHQGFEPLCILLPVFGVLVAEAVLLSLQQAVDKMSRSSRYPGREQKQRLLKSEETLLKNSLPENLYPWFKPTAKIHNYLFSIF
jgi:hypothetical protein